MIVHLHGSHILWLLETLRKKYSLCTILYLYSTTWPVPNISCTNAVISHFWQDYWDKHYTLLGNCPPTPPLSQHVALSEKYVLLLAFGRGRWAVLQKRMMFISVILPKMRDNCIGAWNVWHWSGGWIQVQDCAQRILFAKRFQQP